MERLMEEEGVICFAVMATDAPLGRRMSGAVRVLAPEGAESDKHLFPESCLQDDWTDDYAKSEAFAAEYRAVTDPDDEQKWPKGLTEEDGKLYRNGKLLVPESRVLELCEAWHHHMMHPGVRKQALDMQRRLEIDQIGLYNPIKKVRKGCSVCQACSPDSWNVTGEAQWTPVPDQPMESLATDVFSMPEVHIGKETFHCVVLCVDRPSGYVVAVLARKKRLLAKEVAVMMIRHWLTVFGIPRTICSDRGPQFTGGWFKAMCSLRGIRHAKSVVYLSRSNCRAEVAGGQLFEKLRQDHNQKGQATTHHHRRRTPAGSGKGPHQGPSARTGEEHPPPPAAQPSQAWQGNARRNLRQEWRGTARTPTTPPPTLTPAASSSQGKNRHTPPHTRQHTHTAHPHPHQRHKHTAHTPARAAPQAHTTGETPNRGNIHRRGRRTPARSGGEPPLRPSARNGEEHPPPPAAKPSQEWRGVAHRNLRQEWRGTNHTTHQPHTHQHTTPHHTAHHQHTTHTHTHTQTHAEGPPTPTPPRTQTPGTHTTPHTPAQAPHAHASPQAHTPARGNTQRRGRWTQPGVAGSCP